MPFQQPGLVQPNQQPQVQPPQNGILQRGSLIIFHYMLWKHDPSPMVIVSSVQNGYMIKGVNLHYLTFQYVKKLLAPNINNPGFSYYNISQDRFLVNAYRSYSWRGIVFPSMRVLDGKFLLQMMSLVKSFDPLQVRAIRQEIERQLTMPTNQMQANPTPTTPEQI